MENYLKNFKNCRQKDIPFCAAECPFHIDIPDFIEKMKRGGFKAAFQTYRDAVGFPMIASALCPEPCKGVCPRKDTDSAIDLIKLEKACIAFTEDRSPRDYNLPMKKKKAAVIGAGISGLACALRLCMKKYEVEIFEKEGRIGGSLWNLLSPEIFLEDIEEQFQHEKYTLHLNTPVLSADDLAGRGFDAVYVATGQGGEDFGILSAERSGKDKDGQSIPDAENRHCALFGDTGWFAGGGLVGEEPVYALANGLYMGTVIDNFLKTGNLINPRNVHETCMHLDPEKLKKVQQPVKPANGVSYDQEEAKQEASRCLECQCDFCRTYCDLTEFYNKWPLRIKDEILATTLPGAAEVKMTPAKRLMSTCSQCGLCLETCPENIDMGGLILAGRKSMHKQKKAPWVFHDFWLRDMDFANSEKASIAGIPGRWADTNTGIPGKCANTDSGMEGIPKQPDEGCSYAFFPGCQLGASDPGLVKNTYKYLLDKHPGTGLLLRCCGAPAEWSGDEDKFNGEVERIHQLWRAMGKPALILACPTCEKKFKTYMKDIPVISLYEIMADWGIDKSMEKGIAASTKGPEESVPSGAAKKDPAGEVYSVFDACAARHEKGMKEAVRQLAEKAGCKLEPLKFHDAYEQCCGYGGQSGIANPKYTEFVTQKRISESGNPYITYCINCRDIFQDAGKEAVHILDLLFGSGKPERALPTVSERRENRIRLKREMLREYWNIEMETREEPKRKVIIRPELSRKLNEQRILEEDMIEVVAFCERTGRRVWHPETGTYNGYKEVGNMTYWVEYKTLAAVNADEKQDVDSKPGSYELVNGYAHRMKIELEAVWNGRKTEIDL